LNRDSKEMLVGGVFVVRDEKIVEDVKPGKAVRRSSGDQNNNLQS